MHSQSDLYSRRNGSDPTVRGHERPLGRLSSVYETLTAVAMLKT